MSEAFVASWVVKSCYRFRRYQSRCAIAMGGFFLRVMRREACGFCLVVPSNLRKSRQMLQCARCSRKPACSFSSLVSSAYLGPEFVVHYRNGHRTPYVMSVFEAQLGEGNPQPDATEVLELRFVSEREAEALPRASWVGEVLEAVFHRGRTRTFRAATWNPSSV